jgi:hypothetical protein
MKRSHVLIAVIALLAASNAWSITLGELDNHQPNLESSAGRPLLKVGESFLVARARILKTGWHPTRMQKEDNYEFFDIEKELMDRNLREFDSCSMDAGVLCNLYYNKETKCLRVGTIGEHVKDMKVTRWTDECPEDARSARE